MEKKIVKSYAWKGSYEVREEIVSFDNTPVTMESAYTFNGDYIGNKETADFLCLQQKVKPELRTKDSNVCSIGFCEERQTWVGWSHRAYAEFGIGATVKKGDCAYTPVDEDDFLDDMLLFWDGEDHETISAEHCEEDGERGVRVSWTYSDKIPNEKLRSTISSVFNIYPDRYGKGAQEARTLEDAKEMAIAYADGVS